MSVYPENVLGLMRNQLGESDLRELDDYLDQRVAGMGLKSHTSVVNRILELNQSPSAGFSDYARIIKTDAGLSGKLLKLSNSAFYAQRHPVTNLDRACVLLGNERLKSFSLGYYLSNSAADRSCDFSKRMWGEAVFRACLASELAREYCPVHVVESFVIGLMMDSGLGLMSKLLPGAYQIVSDANLPPRELFEREYELLEFTHIDVIRALMRQWQLPPLLAGPIQNHHALPDPGSAKDAAGKLHRIAYVVGQTDCRGELSAEECRPSLPARCSDILGLPPEELAVAVDRATHEYAAAIDLFSGVAKKVPSPEALAQRVRHQLAETIDSMIERGGGGGATVVERFHQNGTLLELRQTGTDSWVVYLCDDSGGHLAQATFKQSHVQLRLLRESLGLTSDEDAILNSLLLRISGKAA